MGGRKEAAKHHSKGSWYVSPYNFVREIVRKKVEIHDVTLRDGEESSGVVFGRKEKVRIARALEELGIRRIEMGFFIAPPEESLEAVRAVKELGLKARVFAAYGATQKKEGLEMALKSGVEDVVIGYLPVSDMGIKNILRKTREWVKETFLDAISYAKDHGLRVMFFPPDGTRADLDFLKEIMMVCTKVGHADSTVLADSYGVATPEAMAYLTMTLKKDLKVPLEVHPHNDFGLALANALAAFQKGADVIHTSINGLGYRCGNTPTEELVMSLAALYGLDMGINLERLHETSRLVAELSGQPFGHNKPIAGKGAFSFERVGGLSEYMGKGLIYLGLPFNPEVVGRRIEVLLSKWSDMSAVELKLKELGISVTSEKLGKILRVIQKRCMRMGRPVSEAEFKEIAKSVAKDRYP